MRVLNVDETVDEAGLRTLLGAFGGIVSMIFRQSTPEGYGLDPPWPMDFVFVGSTTNRPRRMHTCRRDALVVFESADVAATVLSELAEFEYGGRMLQVVRVSSQAGARPARTPDAVAEPVAKAPTDPSPYPVAAANAVRPVAEQPAEPAARPSAFYYADHGFSETGDAYGGANDTALFESYAAYSSYIDGISAGGASGPGVATAGGDAGNGFDEANGLARTGSNGANGERGTPVKKFGVWVGYFPEGRLIDRRAVMQMFSAVGHVHSVVVPKDPVTGRYE